ncbi:hypothetical protein F5Y19DRAFT_322959 [Xylariaceae sp. FL1651]|nr:hypothetical protein F5Y19DRAFT_322959 [Xylariaceae sp. FL1651]
MAYSQHVASKHQSRRKHHTSSSENHDWEPRRDESRHSLPYRARQPEIQRPGGRRPKYSSHRPRLSEEFLDTRSMPPPVRLLTRSATEKPRSRPVYDDDDDDDDDDDEKERLRGRLRSRSRAGSLASQSSDAITIPTPTRSSYIHHRSAPPSAPSLGSISPSSSGDSESSDSTQDYRPRPRTLKERMNGTPDSEPVISPTSPGEPRRRRRDKVVLEVESLSEHSEDRAPPRHPRLVVKKSPSRHKHRHQSKSPGVALRHHRHQNRHSEGHASSSPKRYVNRTPLTETYNDQFSPSPHKRYYYSDISYSERPTLSRSHTNTTSSSRMTSQSVSSSSKRSSSAFIGNFFPTRSLPAHHDKGSKT